MTTRIHLKKKSSLRAFGGCFRRNFSSLHIFSVVCLYIRYLISGTRDKVVFPNGLETYLWTFCPGFEPCEELFFFQRKRKWTESLFFIGPLFRPVVGKCSRSIQDYVLYIGKKFYESRRKRKRRNGPPNSLPTKFYFGRHSQSARHNSSQAQMKLVWCR